MKNKKTYNTQMDIDFPIALIHHLKESGLNVTQQDIDLVRNAVAYDVAKNLNYSNQGFYVLGDILPRIREETPNPKNLSFLKVVK